MIFTVLNLFRTFSFFVRLILLSFTFCFQRLPYRVFFFSAFGLAPWSLFFNYLPGPSSLGNVARSQTHVFFAFFLWTICALKVVFFPLECFLQFCSLPLVGPRFFFRALTPTSKA